MIDYYQRLFTRIKYNIIDSGIWCGFGVELWGQFGFYDEQENFVPSYGYIFDFETGNWYYAYTFELFYYWSLTGSDTALLPHNELLTYRRSEVGVPDWVEYIYIQSPEPAQNEWKNIDIDMDTFFSMMLFGQITAIEPMVELKDAEGEIWVDRVFYGVLPKTQRDGNLKKHLLV